MQRYNDCRDRAHAITSNARAQGRSTTASEDAEVSAYMSEHLRLGSVPMPLPFRLDNPDADDLRPSTEFVDVRTGRKLHVLQSHQFLHDLPLADNQTFHPLSLGKAIIGLATGKWQNARAEKLAMSEGGNAAGGYIVNEVFSKTVIDAARAQAHVIQAGCVTIPWSEGDRLVMARVVTDPTFSVVPENTDIPPSQPVFDQVAFDAVKIATIVPLSRELAEDAPNAAALVESVLTKAFAVELDRIALVGNNRPNGLLYFTDVQSTDSIGAIAWEDLHEAAVAVRTRNFEPTAYVCSPTIAGDLDLITSGDGVNAAKMWLGPPPSLNGVRRYTSMNCPDANLFIGDWSQLALGIRTDATLEVTNTGGEAFSKHQLLIKLTFRGDVACLHSGAFQCLKGITT